jgi:hypothetical protein
MYAVLSPVYSNNYNRIPCPGNFGKILRKLHERDMMNGLRKTPRPDAWEFE